MRLKFLVSIGVLCSSGLVLNSTASLSLVGCEQKVPTHVQIPRKQPRAEDVSSVDGIIQAYYQVVSGPAKQPRDWGRDATLYIPGVRFVVIGSNKSGKTSAQSMSHQEFVDASDAAMVEKGFYEREIHRITHQAGNVTHVFSTSEHSLTPNGPAQGRSIDSIELYWDGARWWIANATIWELRSGETLPAEFLPK